MTLILRPNLRLVGDVGGTNVRFALVDLASAEPRLVDPRGFLCADFPTLEAAIERYLAERPQATRPDSAVIAVAGPVTDGAANLTNGRWEMSEAALLKRGFASARLINDYCALALAVRRLSPADLGVIGPDHPADAGSVAIVGAGTGLGVGALIRDGDSEAVAVTEGGHIAFAPGDDTEAEILHHLAGRYGRVSLERILSGPGLVNLRWALGRIRGVETPPLEPPQIVERAGAGGDPLCAETLARFCEIYGAACGDFALSFGATGGVYLGGGIPPRILDALRAGGFRARFEAKGRFKPYTARINTQVILYPYAALLGASAARMDTPAASAAAL
ncbi:MAG: glucokinase [Caulobacter sp.]|nr:glucokinase [Caulobacter sp.]